MTAASIAIASEHVAWSMATKYNKKNEGEKLSYSPGEHQSIKLLLLQIGSKNSPCYLLSS
uniref:Uncharacterized protein n=1 Tax=Romanomermis culicivorax TaxID=13658 RepID=A0A915JCK0_ROMCU